MRWFFVAAILLVGCYSRRYFRVPATEEAHACLNYCVNDQVRCRDRAMPGSDCQRWADRCIGDCPGAVEVPYEEWAGDGGV